MKLVSVLRLTPAISESETFRDYPLCSQCGERCATGAERLAEIRAGEAIGICHICEGVYRRNTKVINGKKYVQELNGYWHLEDETCAWCPRSSASQPSQSSQQDAAVTTQQNTHEPTPRSAVTVICVANLNTTLACRS